ncbi:MAG: hypothetical protein A2729_05010 [Candidatus Buchananbacteria bacterium RIFCSPHIGHO2_01_FULL_39_14]|uniref:ASCH domain-containing protein n=1 Tax=Candidatus Buchananbacteria bacterium RIFCSPHIGHO2_01_FULL_39_14 TaxID=1797532 RepID=A0A1G1XSB9_9BACT|nr:MAG: hypothetical protein A2729_05010 [Candidatus Buchananbacteria bacterium RIFCSPHIGHO2_01_FULL_39_14]
MHHIAFMKKSWNLIPKILAGEKTIESRWYVNKITPWDNIKEDDTIYFKNGGEPITATAQVEKVLQFEHYTKSQLKNILKTYGGNPGICFPNINQSFQILKQKNYCILIFLKNQKPIEPFHINKTGFGNACAWISVEDIEKIKISNTLK